MKISEIAQEVYEVNQSKGFWKDKDSKNVGEVLMLCVSELAEALEAHRVDHHCRLKSNEKINALENSKSDEYQSWFQSNVKNSFEDEIADTMIRLLDLSVGFEIDIEWHIRAKLEYNKTRSYKHGKAY